MLSWFEKELLLLNKFLQYVLHEMAVERLPPPFVDRIHRHVNTADGNAELFCEDVVFNRL